MIARLLMTRGGQLRVNIWNSIEETIYLTPKITMIVVTPTQIIVRHLGQDPKFVHTFSIEERDFEERLKAEITQKFPKAEDFNAHPVNSIMKRMCVQASKVGWRMPLE